MLLPRPAPSPSNGTAYRIFIITVNRAHMASLTCRDYGFECDYVVEGEVDYVVDRFRDHMEMEHGIEYAREAILQFVMRKQRA